MKYEMDMCSGSLPKKMLLFAVPLILSSCLQLLFNAVDIIVVGRYVGDGALAAVGSTGALINLLTNLFLGLSVGANVLVARYFGAKSDRDVEEVVHTSVAASLLCGVFLAIVGILGARPLLAMMDTPGDVIAQSTLYMRIYFVGMPIMLFYNFGSAVLRAVGDTRRPLVYLAIAGVVNLCLNLFFVLVLHRGVDGVAYATVLSQAVSAFLILRNLMTTESAYRFSFSKLRITKNKMLSMMRIGLPAGLQGCIFSFSNVLIQSSINSFGKIAMAGNTAASNIEGFVYVAMNAFHHTTLSFTGQNYGGGKYERINKILGYGLLFVTIAGLSMGLSAILFGDALLGLYTKSAETIVYGKLRLFMICSLYFTCGTMDTVVGSLRGLGYSVVPMIVSLIGACGLRIVWIYTIFRMFPTLRVLYLSYPISWLLTTIAHLLCFLYVRKKIAAQIAARAQEV